MFDIVNRTSSLVVDRRKFLAGAAGFIAAGLLPKKVLALAAPYSFKHGSFDVTIISDGQLILPVGIIAPDAPQEEVRKLLATVINGDSVTAEANTTLIKSASDVILFDTGSGQGFQPTAGKILDNLKLAGVDPATVTKVVFTHGHPDHIWGTVGAEGALTFPNASYHVNGAEWDFWMDKDLINKFPKEMQGIVTGAQKHFTGVKERVKMFKPGDELVTGITVIDAAGHTPGHVTFALTYQEGLLLMADTINSPFIGFAHPDWRFGFDAIPELAIASRKRLLDMAAADQMKMIGYHWPYPGIGYAGKKDGAFHFVAA